MSTTATAPAPTNGQQSREIAKKPAQSLAIANMDHLTVLEIPDLRKFIGICKHMVTDALPAKMKDAAPRYIISLIEACQEKEKLRLCTSHSLMAGLIKVASYGLELGKEIYLIPRKGKAVPQLGYGGVAALCERHPKVLKVGVNIVREGDEFEEICGGESKIIHKPKRNNTGKITEYYGIVKLRNGEQHHVVRTPEQIDAHRKRYCENGTNPDGSRKENWLAHFDAMALKTVLIMACKYAPKSIELPEWDKIEEPGDETVLTVIDPNLIDKPRRQIETLDTGDMSPEQREQLRQVETTLSEAEKEAVLKKVEAAPGRVLRHDAEIVAEIEKLAVAARGSWENVRTSGLLESVKFKGTRVRDMDLAQAQAVRVLLQAEVDAKASPTIHEQIDTLIGQCAEREDTEGTDIECDVCRVFGAQSLEDVKTEDLPKVLARLQKRYGSAK